MLRWNKDNREDRSLVKACQAGDEAAMRRLYERHYRTMFAVCLRYCRSREDAQDVLQEAFVSVFRKLEEWRGDGSLEGWIRRVVVGKAIDFYRSQKKIMNLYEDAEIIDADGSPWLDHGLENQSTAEALAAAIRQLPDRSRLVFNLFAVEGYSHKEIAQELGIEEGTSKSQLAHARKLLQKYLQPVC